MRSQNKKNKKTLAVPELSWARLCLAMSNTKVSKNARVLKECKIQARGVAGAKGKRRNKALATKEIQKEQ